MTVPPHEKMSPDPVVSVLKVFGILEALAEQRDNGISELSQRLNMSKATVYRFLQTMKGLGYLHQDADKERYGLTMKLFELGSKALEYADLIPLADRQMHILSDKFSETVHLGVPNGIEFIYVHKIDSMYELRMHSRIGRPAPVYCTAIGKVLLAWETPERREQILSQISFKRILPNTPDTVEGLRAQLEKTLSQGYGEDNQEYCEKMHCLAAPVFDRLGHVIAGISISFPIFRFEDDRIAEYVSMLHQAARTVSMQLGCAHYPLDKE